MLANTNSSLLALNNTRVEVLTVSVTGALTMASGAGAGVANVEDDYDETAGDWATTQITQRPTSDDDGSGSVLQDYLGIVWHLHVFGFGACFCIFLPVACFLQCAHTSLCLRISTGDSCDSSQVYRPKRVCLVLLATYLTTFAATLKGVSLLVDPYGTTHLLPQRFVRLANVLLHPSYITVVFFIQYALHLATKVNLVLSALHNPYFVGVMVLVHFSVTIASEFVSGQGKAAFAMVFMKAFFIFWCYFIDAMFFAFSLKVRSYLDELIEDVRSWQLRGELQHGPYSLTSVPIGSLGTQSASQSASKRVECADSEAANSVRVLHAKYFGTCGDNAVYTGMNDVDYDNLVVSISEIECSVSFSAKADKQFLLSNSTTTTSIADRLSQHSVGVGEVAHTHNTNLSPLSSDTGSRNGDLSSNSRSR